MSKKDKKSKGKKKKGSKKTGNQITLNSSIALDRLIHVVMKKKNKKGKKIRCLVIPIKENLLEVDDYGIHLPIRIIYRPEQDEKTKQNGFVSKTIGSNTYKNASDKQKEQWKDFDNKKTQKQTPILGNIKDWGSNSSKSQAASAKDIGEDDDLPF